MGLLFLSIFVTLLLAGSSQQKEANRRGLLSTFGAQPTAFLTAEDRGPAPALSVRRRAKTPPPASINGVNLRELERVAFYPSHPG